MESFTIQCTSCESRIRVRNPNMIGQIANCPKCGSMILISAPQKITVESGNPTDSVAVTREALPKPDESLLKVSTSSFETGFRIDGLPEPPPSPEFSPAQADDYHLAPLPEDESAGVLWMHGCPSHPSTIQPSPIRPRRQKPLILMRVFKRSGPSGKNRLLDRDKSCWWPRSACAVC